MKTSLSCATLVLAGVLASIAQSPRAGAGSSAPQAPLAHARSSFEFTVHAPRNVVAPLLGAQGERAWANGWDPHFLYPQPPEDRAGVVFTVADGGSTSTWITTVFDPDQGHIQHVYFVPGAMTSLIDIRLTSSGASETRVQVTYECTALSPDANDHVRHVADSHGQSGPHWQHAIQSYLDKAQAKPPGQ